MRQAGEDALAKCVPITIQSSTVVAMPLVEAARTYQKQVCFRNRRRIRCLFINPLLTGSPCRTPVSLARPDYDKSALVGDSRHPGDDATFVLVIGEKLMS